MLFDYSELLDLMEEKGITRRYICRKLDISYNTFSNKINGQTYFTTLEMKIISKILKIKKTDIGRYFLTEN